MSDRSSSTYSEPRQVQFFKKLQETVKRLLQPGGLSKVSSEHHMNGIFKKLCDKGTCQEMLFPGIAREDRDSFPRDLKEVLEWKELHMDLGKIAQNAATAFENIKLAGEKRGDTMDAATEMVLTSQVAQEALGKAVVEAVRVLNKLVSSLSSKGSIPIASSSAKEAAYDQIDREVLSALRDTNGPKFAIQHDYLGEDWAKLILKDMTRFVKNEKMTAMSPFGEVVLAIDTPMNGRSNSSSSSSSSSSSNSSHINACSRMCWIDRSTFLSVSYPAIFELVEQMHALPFEINAKWGADVKLKLLEPTRGCTMLVYYPRGSCQQARMDNKFHDGGPRDTGIRLTCSYHLEAVSEEDEVCDSPSVFEFSENENVDNTDDIGQRKKKKSQLVFSSPQSDSEERAIATFVEVQSDILTFHHSTLLRNERPLIKSDGYFVLSFFILGRTG